MAPAGQQVPAHVGIIMDGNGRWARQRNLPRTSGHREGLEVAKRIVAHASDLGISVLSLYTFSTENWRRTEEEVSFLMGLISTHLRRQYDFYRERGIRVIHSGNLEPLPPAVRREIVLVEEDTAEFTGMHVHLLINYGGRDEIVRAVQNYQGSGGDFGCISEDAVQSHLDHPELVDPDLIIRTGGELRLSNYLLWQSAYAELYFSEDYWPDWTPEHLDDALADYSRRKRRYGGET